MSSPVRKTPKQKGSRKSKKGKGHQVDEGEEDPENDATDRKSNGEDSNDQSKESSSSDEKWSQQEHNDESNGEEKDADGEDDEKAPGQAQQHNKVLIDGTKRSSWVRMDVDAPGEVKDYEDTVCLSVGGLQISGHPYINDPFELFSPGVPYFKSELG